MKELFKSNEYQKQFEKDGFVKLALLSKIQVAELMAFYKTVAAEHENINIPYITTSHSNNPELIAKVDAVLQRVIAPALENYLINYKLLFGNYLIKIPGEGSETAPHQDITFVDESKYTSVNIWVALQDIDKENGCMYFLKGSQAFIPTIRPTHDYPWAYELVTEEIKRYSDSFTANAGDAFVFNHAVVHGSYPNMTKQPRLAAVIAAYPDEAELIHYFLPPNEKKCMKKYRMTKEAYLSFVKHQPPEKGIFLNEIDCDFKQVNTKEFKTMLKKAKGHSPSQDFFQSIKQAIYG